MSHPKPFSVERVRASVRATRGQRADGRWYWRAVQGSRSSMESVWTGWATRAEAMRAVLDAVEGRSGGQVLSTVRDLLEGYVWDLEHQRTDIVASTRSSRRTSAEHLVGRVGHVHLEAIEPLLPGLRDSMLQDGMAPRTVERHLVALRCAWNWARQRRLVTSSLLIPQVRIPRHRPYVYNHHTPTEEDLRRVLGDLETRRGPNWWAAGFCHVLTATGARAGEVAALRPADLNVERATLTVSGKTGVRVLPVSPALITRLSQVSGWARGCGAMHRSPR